MMTRSTAILGLTLLTAASAWSEPLPIKGKLLMDSIAGSHWHMGGEVGRRVDCDIENWLLRVPDANPGLLDMFQVRDRHLPYPEPVPWAGEFAGKYLISAVQACRMTDDPRLAPFVQDFVNQLVASQADNGYLGPWPKDKQLLEYWDLWGHYHCMLGLLMWYDATGDQKAYDGVIRAADCICRLYVDGGRRPIEAGSPPMNLSIIHIMGELYLRTGNPKYMELIQRVVEDLPKDGDWLEKGAQGVPYYKLPGNGLRWESLHIVQGFAKLYQITGDEKYKEALLSLWNSIRQYDRHPSGAFSSNEGAIGTIYRKGSIETCCSVAWMALTIDALKLTEDPTMADELELTLYNQALAAQHPSGNWCTYDTPLNGVRAPSYHQINFQYRPGTPELNCCSVNSPRTLGMVSEWALMRDADGLVVNFYGPGEFNVSLADGAPVKLIEKTDYPVEGLVKLEVQPKKTSAFSLKLRIPAWSKQTTVKLNGKVEATPIQPGTYLALKRKWKKGDRIELVFDMTPRYQAGAAPDYAGRAAIHAGPLLLAFDTHYNPIELSALKPIDVTNLHLDPVPVDSKCDIVHYPPMGLWKTATDGGDPITLCDFASAGANGTEYAAWLPASHLPPAATSLRMPAHDAQGKPGPVLFAWQPSRAPGYAYDLVIAKDPEFKQIVVEQKGITGADFTVTDGLAASGDYFWKVRSVNPYGATENDGGPRPFHIDPAAAQPFFSIRADGLMFASPLDGDGTPSYGIRNHEQGVAPAPDRHGHAHGAVTFSPEGSRLRYSLPFFPERDYACTLWMCPEGLPSTAPLRQALAAWCASMDSPLRVTITGHELSARLETAGAGYATPGVPLKNGQWIHVAAIKQGTTLTLYINGKAAQSCAVPELVHSQCTEIGIGCNPAYADPENFQGKIDNAAFYARALNAEEIERDYKAGRH